MGFEIKSLQANNTIKDLEIGTGDYYVKGILCENEKMNDEKGNEVVTTYYYQPYYPINKDKERLPDPPFIVYLDVWERHITALEDDHIREKALGGPDTATRTQTVWQVRLDQVIRGAPTCSSVPREWNERFAPPNPGELSAQAVPGAPTDDPCELAPGGGYAIGSSNSISNYVKLDNYRAMLDAALEYGRYPIDCQGKLMTSNGD